MDIGRSSRSVAGGHITPLAHDTLRARRVTVVRDVVDADLTRPRARRRHSPRRDRQRSLGRRAEGRAARRPARPRASPSRISARNSTDPVDYPGHRGRGRRGWSRASEADAGIVIDGAGLGSAIAANKIDGVRAAMCTDRTLARYAREHNGANVLALGATLVTTEDAKAIVQTWLATPMREARYIRRLAKIRRSESRDERDLSRQV